MSYERDFYSLSVKKERHSRDEFLFFLVVDGVSNILGSSVSRKLKGDTLCPTGGFPTGSFGGQYFTLLY